MLLVVTDSAAGNLRVYLDQLTAIEGAVTRRHAKHLNLEKNGHEFVLAYDHASPYCFTSPGEGVFPGNAPVSVRLSLLPMWFFLTFDGNV